MSSFTNELKVKPTEDGKMWILLEDFEYYLGDLDSGVSIKVPAGFITDFASVPQFLWWILPPFGKYTKPAVCSKNMPTIAATNHLHVKFSIFSLGNSASKFVKSPTKSKIFFEE